MDLDSPVTYRGVELNTIEVLPGESKRKGCLIEEADFGDVMGVGYSEKRAQGDGNDASDVYLGPRTVRLRGYVYGETKADGFDRLQQLRSALTPTAAYLDSPSEKGYLPLMFDVPTENLVHFPDGVKLMQMFVRPRAQPQFSIRRDQGSQTGIADRGNAIAWAAQLEAKDPRIYLRDDTGLPYTGSEYFTTGETGVLLNRGDYPSPVDVLLDVAAGASGSSTCRIQLGGADLTIKVPNSSQAQIIRYSASLKVLTVEVNTVETLRMDLMVMDAGNNHLLLPASTPVEGSFGENPYVISRTGSYTLGPNTRLMYNEAFA